MRLTSSEQAIIGGLHIGAVVYLDEQTGRWVMSFDGRPHVYHCQRAVKYLPCAGLVAEVPGRQGRGPTGRSVRLVELGAAA
jgi:hypothetical protein